MSLDAPADPAGSGGARDDDRDDASLASRGSSSVERLAYATVAIIGVGLVGGSLGRALAGQCAWRIGVVAAGVDTVAPVTSGCVDVVAPADAAAGAADIIVLATPVLTIVELLPNLAQVARAGAVLTDVGSTKRTICAAMELLPEHVEAVGGHPMAGAETPGLEHADGELFEGKSWAVVRTGRSTDRSMALVEQLVAAVGAEVVPVTAEDHDRIVALTSHVPFLLGNGLLDAHKALVDEFPAAAKLVGGGFRDVTRLARGDARMWSDIVTTNGDEIERAMGLLGASID